MTSIDVFAHVLPPHFYNEMLAIQPDLPEKMPFIKHPLLIDIEQRRLSRNKNVQQVISAVNVNPEDYVGTEQAAVLCWQANNEMIEMVKQNPDIFKAGIAMVPLNNIDEAIRILKEQVLKNPELVGIQLFTRALGKSIAAKEYRVIFEMAAQLNIPILLHPIFDDRKPDNNIIFSWEYELTQAMLQLVQSGIFNDYPTLKIIVHHAGAMVPYFAERINHILSPEQAADFKRFYVDTALLGNPKALGLAIDYYGVNHVLFGTDAPLGIAPAGATDAIIEALDQLNLSKEDRALINYENYNRLMGLGE
ncbi:amidohydrolase family protein [Dellaglioa sp. P0083]|uniref:amidohydrolase family protein n=1 Tax=Dellaglioa kimchii TaxID=3344667 RepID=UPI0038D4EA68